METASAASWAISPRWPDSIAEKGLSHPVVVTPDNCLIAGQRRLEAMRELGRTHVRESSVGDARDQVARYCGISGKDETVIGYWRSILGQVQK